MIAPRLAHVALPLTALLAGCGALSSLGVPEPTARLAGVRFERLSPAGLTLVFDVAIRNPYAAPLPLSGVEFALASGGASILEGEVHSPTPIPARGEGTVAVPASIEFADLARAAGSVVPGTLLPYEVNVAFSADAPGGARIRIPFRHEGELPVPITPDVTVERLTWETLRLDLAAAVVEFRVGNRNSFSIDLAGFAYALDLGGRTVARGAIANAGAVLPNGARTIPIRITFAPVDLGVAAFGMLQGSTARYALRGELRLGSPFGEWHAPFERTGEARAK